MSLSAAAPDVDRQRGHAAAGLLITAADVLDDAARCSSPQRRFSNAYVAALRAAAAVVAATRSRRSGSGPRSVWSLLASSAPELTEWAEYFAALTGQRLAVESGAAMAVSQRQADDLLRDVAAFLDHAVVAVQRRAPLPTAVAEDVVGPTVERLR